MIRKQGALSMNRGGFAPRFRPRRADSAGFPLLYIGAGAGSPYNNGRGGFPKPPPPNHNRGGFHKKHAPCFGRIYPNENTPHGVRICPIRGLWRAGAYNIRLWASGFIYGRIWADSPPTLPHIGRGFPYTTHAPPYYPPASTSSASSSLPLLFFSGADSPAPSVMLPV